MTTATARDRRLFGPGPKRILTLDGGGTRGIVAVAFLERIEAMLAARAQQPDFRLADYFDLIAGTSTGAIVAAALALGKSVAEVRHFYDAPARRAFRGSFWRIPGLSNRFDANALEQEIRATVGERTLATADLRTGFAIVAKRLDTGSPWIIANNPRSVFWNDPGDGSFTGNRHYPLANLIRASTAAPGYFKPERIAIAAGEPAGLFIDGGLTPYNNPALLVLMMTQLEAYGLTWPLGQDEMLMISIGTGQFRRRVNPDRTAGASPAAVALHALEGMIRDAENATLAWLQWLGQSDDPWSINSEIGDLAGEHLAGRPLFRFQRYTLELEAEALERSTGQAPSNQELRRLRRIDRPEMVPELARLARLAAAEQIKDAHFPTAFDEPSYKQNRLTTKSP